MGARRAAPAAILAFWITSRVDGVAAVVVPMRNVWPAMQPSPKKSPGPNIATTASLPEPLTTDNFTPPFCNLHYRFCRLTLGINGFVSAVFHHFSRHAGSIEKLLGIKRAERWSGLGILAGFDLHFGCRRYFTQKAPARPNKVTRGTAA
jgi:hypothetical protein